MPRPRSQRQLLAGLLLPSAKMTRALATVSGESATPRRHQYRGVARAAGLLMLIGQRYEPNRARVAGTTYRQSGYIVPTGLGEMAQRIRKAFAYLRTSSAANVG